MAVWGHSWAGDGPYPVLVLASEDSQSRLEAEMIEGLREELSSQADLIIDYLDVKRMSYHRHYLERYEAVFHGKYKRRRPAVVVALNDEAVRVLGYYHTDVFAGVPKVVFGSHPAKASKYLSRSNCWTGVFSEPDLPATIDLALELHPDLQQIHLMTGRTIPGQSVRSRLKKMADAGRFPLAITMPGKEQGSRGIWGMNEAATYLRELGDRDLVVFSEFLPTLRGNEYLSSHLIRNLIRGTIAPVYSTQADAIGEGAIGGHVVNGRLVGRALGGLVRRVLGGGAPHTMPPVVLPGEWLFDHAQLKRWHVPPGRLPTGARILNRPFEELRKYAWLILGGGGIILLEAIIIFQLWLSRRRRLSALHALKNSEARYRSVYETSREIFIILSPGGVIWHANPAACRCLQYSLKEMCGFELNQLADPGEQARIRARMARVLREGGALLETSLKSRDGTRVEIEASFHACDFNGEPAVVCSARLLSEQLKFQQIAQEIIEREREALGCDIHDGLGPYGTALQMQCFALKEGIKRGETIDDRILESLSGIAESLTLEVRNLARVLVPLRMVDRTLEEALNEVMDIGRRIFRVNCEMTFRLDESKISIQTATQIYRIIQEYLRNAARHAGSRQARLELTEDVRGAGQLVIQTDGQPFAPQASRRTGLGLVIMQNRARMIKGTLSIGMADGGWTRLICRFPLDGTASPESIETDAEPEARTESPPFTAVFRPDQP